MTKYVVVGSGIVGLYTTLNLLQRDVRGSEITVLAEYLPGDQSINYTSPWAGGNFSCISPDDEQTLRFDKKTYTNLEQIKSLLGSHCGLDQLPSTEYWDYVPDAAKIRSLSSYLKNFSLIEREKLPKGVEYGITYTTWNFNCPLFLANLKQYLASKGVSFVRRRIEQVNEAYISPATKTVFNCTGIGARSLKGAEDEKIYPARGQVVVVRAPHIQQNVMRWGSKDVTYIIPRPHSHHQVVLGGYYQKGNWDADTWGHETEDILERTTALLSEVAHDQEIIRVACGLRPGRDGGVRVEKEPRSRDRDLVHVTGLAGYGYQAGYGAAHLAVELALTKENKL